MNSDEYLLGPTPLEDLPRERFVQGWTAIVGEPPSIMLDQHRQMIALLIEAVPADPAGAWPWSARRQA